MTRRRTHARCATKLRRAEFGPLVRAFGALGCTGHDLGAARHLCCGVQRRGRQSDVNGRVHFGLMGRRPAPVELTTVNAPSRSGGKFLIPTGRGVEQFLGVFVLGRGKNFRSGACSTMTPRCMTAIRSQTCAATLKSWVMNSTARSNLRRTSSNSFST